MAKTKESVSQAFPRAGICRAAPTDDQVRQMLREGALLFLQKPYSVRLLRLAVEVALRDDPAGPPEAPPLSALVPGSSWVAVSDMRGQAPT